MLIRNDTGATTDSLPYYYYTDKDAPAGINYYRVKAIYLNKYSYSKSIKTSKNCYASEFDVSVYPNPVITNNADVLITSQEKAMVNISLLNSYGQIVKSQYVSIIKDKNDIKLSMDGLKAGIYTLSVNNGKQSKSLKLYKSK